MTLFEPDNDSTSFCETDSASVYKCSADNRTWSRSTNSTTIPSCDTVMAESTENDLNDLEILCNQLNSVEMEDEFKRPRWVETPSKMYTETPKGPVYEDKMFTSDRIYSQDKDGDTLLHIAIILREPRLIVLFISEAASARLLSLQNLLFQTPLHLAVLTNQPEVVRRLVVAGAELELRDKDGNTPLHLACREGQVKIVQYLLEPVRYQETIQNSYNLPYRGIPQNFAILNYEGQTCLHLAFLNGQVGIVEVLIDKGIDVNMKECKAGRTILHQACISGDVNLVRFLLRHKSCDINARTYDDSTPLDYARARGQDEVCTILLAAGARYGEECSDSE